MYRVIVYLLDIEYRFSYFPICYTYKNMLYLMCVKVLKYSYLTLHIHKNLPETLKNITTTERDINK